MAVVRRRKSIGGSKCYRPWNSWSEGDQVVGKFVEIGEDTYGKPNYVIEIEELNFEHEVAEGKMKAEVGARIGLNSAGNLDYKMKEVEIGQIVEITYEGTEVLPDNHKFKGKACHQVEVVVLEDEEDSEDNLSDL